MPDPEEMPKVEQLHHMTRAFTEPSLVRPHVANLRCNSRILGARHVIINACRKETTPFWEETASILDSTSP